MCFLAVALKLFICVKTLNEDDIQNGKEILYYDVTSECPFVNSQKEYPVGHPKIFLKHHVPQTNEEWQR